MISSYALTTIGNLTDRFSLASGLPKGVKPFENSKPTELLPVIFQEDGKRVLQRMKWGFLTQGAQNTHSVFRYKTFTVRSEDVFKKKMYAKSIRTQRCIVPVDYFYYEVHGETNKATYRVSRQDGTLIGLAGIYSRWNDAEGVEWGMFSIVTTTANKDMRAIDRRMPVILTNETESQWLDSSIDDMNSLYDMMRPYPAGELSITEAKTRA